MAGVVDNTAVMTAAVFIGMKEVLVIVIITALIVFFSMRLRR
jgi:hypothetical protein